MAANELSVGDRVVIRAGDFVKEQGTIVAQRKIMFGLRMAHAVKLDTNRAGANPIEYATFQLAKAPQPSAGAEQW